VLGPPKCCRPHIGIEFCSTSCCASCAHSIGCAGRVLPDVSTRPSTPHERVTMRWRDCESCCHAKPCWMEVDAKAEFSRNRAARRLRHTFQPQPADRCSAPRGGGRQPSTSAPTRQTTPVRRLACDRVRGRRGSTQPLAERGHRRDGGEATATRVTVIGHGQHRVETLRVTWAHLVVPATTRGPSRDQGGPVTIGHTDRVR